MLKKNQKYRRKITDVKKYFDHLKKLMMLRFVEPNLKNLPQIGGPSYKTIWSYKYHGYVPTDHILWINSRGLEDGIDFFSDEVYIKDGLEFKDVTDDMVAIKAQIQKLDEEGEYTMGKEYTSSFGKTPNNLEYYLATRTPIKPKVKVTHLD